MKVSKALTVSVSVFRGQISSHFSLSKNNISPAAPDLELILFPLLYWAIMNTHTKQQQDKMFETDSIDGQKSDPPFAHLLALSHRHLLQTGGKMWSRKKIFWERSTPCYILVARKKFCYGARGSRCLPIFLYCSRKQRLYIKWRHWWKIMHTNVVKQLSTSVQGWSWAEVVDGWWL